MEKVALIGGGGHSRVLIEALRQMGSVEIVGIYDNDSSMLNKSIMDVPVVGLEDDLLKQDNQDILLVNGIGTIKSSNKRDEIFKKFKAAGFDFITISHPSAVIASDVILNEGVQVMAGVVIQPGCNIQANTILNTSCSIDHDSNIGQSVHIAPGVTISGTVSIGNQTHVGTGANVIQGIKIGDQVTVAAGATVCNDITSNQTVKGCPAR